MTKRRGRGEGSVYFRQSDQRWVAALDLGVVNGRRKRKPFYGRKGEKKTDVLKRLAVAQQQQAAGTLVVDRATVQSWLLYWLEQVAAHRVRASTYRSYDVWVRRICAVIGHRPLEKLQPAHVRELYATLRSDGLSASSLRQCHAVLHRALVVAVRDGKVARNVCDLIDPPDSRQAQQTPLTLEQAQKVLAAADATPDGVRWWCALWLGMRQGEVLALRWADFEQDRRELRVAGSLSRVKGEGLVVGPTKSASSFRAIPVPASVWSRLMVYRATRGRPPPELGFMFGPDPWAAYEPRDPRRDWDEWKALLNRAGVPHVPLRLARNTAASLMLDAGIDAKLVQQILGHAKVTITQDVYQVGSDDMLHRAVEQLDTRANVLRIGNTEG